MSSPSDKGRIPGYSRWYWLDFLAIPVLCLAVSAGLIGPCAPKAKAGDQDEAAAALALAKAKRDRQKAQAAALPLGTTCYTDYKAAVAEGKAKNKPLVLWVGVTCKEHPYLRKALDCAVHCHLPLAPGDDVPKIIFRGLDDNQYFIQPKKFTEQTADKIRARWEMPPAAPVAVATVPVAWSYQPVAYAFDIAYC